MSKLESITEDDILVKPPKKRNGQTTCKVVYKGDHLSFSVKGKLVSLEEDEHHACMRMRVNTKGSQALVAIDERVLCIFQEYVGPWFNDKFDSAFVAKSFVPTVVVEKLHGVIARFALIENVPYECDQYVGMDVSVQLRVSHIRIRKHSLQFEYELLDVTPCKESQLSFISDESDMEDDVEIPLEELENMYECICSRLTDIECNLQEQIKSLESKLSIIREKNARLKESKIKDVKTLDTMCEYLDNEFFLN